MKVSKQYGTWVKGHLNPVAMLGFLGESMRLHGIKIDATDIRELKYVYRPAIPDDPFAGEVTAIKVTYEEEVAEAPESGGSA